MEIGRFGPNADRHRNDEKLRELNGYGFAVNNKGEMEIIDIRDIYEKAEHLGTEITQVVCQQMRD